MKFSKNIISVLYKIFIFLFLFLVWILFSGMFDLFHISLGVLSCYFVLVFSSDLFFKDRSIPVDKRIIQTIKLIQYLIWLVWEIVLSNVHIFRLAFGKKSLINSQIIKYKTSLNTDFQKFLLANSITITPGTVTVKIVDDIFYIHSISDVTSSDIGKQMEDKISSIFRI